MATAVTPAPAFVGTAKNSKDTSSGLQRESPPPEADDGVAIDARAQRAMQARLEDGKRRVVEDTENLAALVQTARTASGGSVADAVVASSNDAASRDEHLPADFRVQLQVLDCMAQQGRLLQQLTDQQKQASAQFAALQRETVRQREALYRYLDKQQNEVDLQLKEGQREIMGALREDRLSAWMTVGTNDDSDGDINPADELPRTLKPLKGEASVGEQSKKSPFASEEIPFVASEDKRASGAEHYQPTFLQELVKSPKFESICGLVIVVNAVSIGWGAELAAQWAFSNIGDEAGNTTPQWLTYLGYFFVAFYTAELFVKLAIFKRRFFSDEDWKWNMFDLTLVITAGYDFLTEVLQLDAGLNVTWMRLLRLMKMLKMLRVVRVMRFFKELRTMISSIAGSVSALAWSIIMLFLMNYIFGLVFLQGITTFLTEHTEEEIGEEMMQLINQYWSGVPQACLTLYFALSGGGDWEPLAEPLRKAGFIYYSLFLFFIAFSSIAVLNVLTGMFVDAAMKVVDVDESNVVQEKTNSPPVQKYRKFLKSIAEQSTKIMEHEFIESIMDDETVSFFREIEIDQEDARRVFKMLAFQDCCSIDDFIDGCMKVKEDIKGIDMVALKAELKRLVNQLAVMTHGEAHKHVGFHAHMAPARERSPAGQAS